MRRHCLMMATTLLLTGCHRTQESTQVTATDSRAADVFVTSQLLLEMARSISGDSLEIQKITPNEVSSRHWKPKKGDIQKLQQAKAILINGAGYEPWKARASLPGSRVHDTSKGYHEQFIRIPDAVIHQHGPDGNHTHSGTVWATWLDPALAISQLSQVTNRLAELAPEQQSQFERSSRDLKATLESLDEQVAQLALVVSERNVTFVADGPFYQYLTKRLGVVELKYTHWDDAERFGESNCEELRTLVKTLPADGASPRLFLIDDRHSNEAVKCGAELGLIVIPMDLCEFPVGDNQPWVERLRGNVTRIKAAIAAIR